MGCPTSITWLKMKLSGLCVSNAKIAGVANPARLIFCAHSFKYRGDVSDGFTIRSPVQVDVTLKLYHSLQLK